MRYLIFGLLFVGVFWIGSQVRIEKICGGIAFEDGSWKPDCWLELDWGGYYPPN